MKLNLEDYKENRKDQRTEKQATQQSQILEQRNNNQPAIDFENEFSFDENYI